MIVNLIVITAQMWAWWRNNIPTVSANIKTGITAESSGIFNLRTVRVFLDVMESATAG